MSELERRGMSAASRPDEYPGTQAAPGRARPYRAMVCGKCGANEHVHRGLCRRCRRLLLGDGRIAGTELFRGPHEASPEPLHSPPWRRRGA
jgi:hypothetical protein